LAHVPNREGIHAPKFMDHARSMLSVEMQEHFSVGTGAELAAESKELGAKSLVVINFAVESNAQVTVPIPHWLGAGFGKIDDRQAAMGERDSAVWRNPFPCPIWTARDGNEFVALHTGSVSAVSKDGGYATHLWNPESWNAEKLKLD
jgi:hypothetical protein